MSILTTHKGITYTGGNSDTLPILLHPTGAPGANHRWVAKAHSLGALATAADQVGGLALTGTATVVDSSGQRFFRFNGTSNTLTATGLSDIATVTVVARVNAPDGTNEEILDAGIIRVARTAGSTVAAPTIEFVNGGGSTGFLPAQTNGPAFHAITVIRGAVNSSIVVDDYTDTRPSGSSDLSRVRLGSDGTDFGQIDVLEVITWPTALPVATVADVHAALRSHYGTALA